MKKLTKQKLIYLRYILPPVLLVLILLMGFLPSYRYVSEGEAHAAVSLWTLVGDSWEIGRETLFAKSDANYGELAFSKTNLILIAVFVLLSAAAIAVAVWSCYVALKLFISDDEEGAEKSRVLFITFLPNRIVTTVLEWLIIPLCLYPYILPALYAHTLAMEVRIALIAPDGLILAGVSLVAIGVLSAFTAQTERDFDADIFKRRRPFEPVAQSESEENGESDYESLFDARGEESEEQRAAREADAERIRRILRGEDEERR